MKSCQVIPRLRSVSSVQERIRLHLVKTPTRIGLLYLRANLAPPLLVCLVFSSFFVLLRSQNYLAVDGAIRCFEVYHREHLFFHGNNHLLYPLNILAWHRFLTELGRAPNGPLEFISQMQVMNCLAGAGCLALLYFLTHIVTSSWRLALAVTVGCGFSRAFLLHATNSAEPMLGVFWSLLAFSVAVSSIKFTSIWPIGLSGLLFSLAMATYQSTILLALAAIVLVWQRRSLEGSRASQHSAQYVGLGAFAVSGFVGTAIIYGVAYWLSGIRSFSAMFKRFLTVDGGVRVYGGISISKILNTPVGMLLNLFPILPSGYAGVRSLWRGGHKLLVVWLLLLVLLFCGFLAISIIQALRRWSTLPRSERMAMSCAAVGFFVTLIPAVFWEPTYDKLWLQPLACLAFFIALSLHVILRQGTTFLLYRIVPILLLAGVISNLGWAVKSRLQETPYLKEAQQLAKILKKGDLVVGDYDGVSVLYGSIWADDVQVFSFPTEATLVGNATASRLREVIVGTQSRGGRVYFLGVLDQTQDSWNAFLWRRCGVSYSDMDLYRAHSRVRTEFKHEGFVITLREFDQPAFTPPS